MLEKLGVGSYGKVKKCKDINTGEKFAMKIFLRQALRKPRMNRERTTALDDVLREIRIMSSLHHPNVVELVEVLNDSDHERLYMVIQYCKHGPLMKKNMEDYHFEMHQVKQYARDILEGVRYIHDHHVCHRDIKPENLLLYRDGVVKISDFGVSEEFVDGEDMLSRTAGTPSFTAPELITAGQPKARGRRADIFAIGVTLYCLAFSQTPFQGNTVMEVYDQIRTHNVTFPETTEADFVLLIQGLLERNPLERWTIEQALASPWLVGTVAR